MDTEMTAPDEDAPETEPQEAETQVEPSRPPNEALALKVTEALVRTGVVAETDSDRCERLLASGDATPEDWQRLIETSLFPRETPEEDAETDN